MFEDSTDSWYTCPQVPRGLAMLQIFVLLGGTIICRLHKLTLLDQGHVTAIDSWSLRFGVLTSDPPAFASEVGVGRGGGGKKISTVARTRCLQPCW